MAAAYRRVFSIPTVGRVHREFLATIRAFEEVEAVAPGRAAATVTRLRAAYLDFNEELDRVAKDTAADARVRIVRILKLRQKRPSTGMGNHLAPAVICRPLHDFGALATGEVGIADIARLDRVTNPFGPQYGPYWRAIELGTRRHLGRRVTGAFFGRALGSGPFAPDPSQFRAHPIFVTAAQGADVFGDLGFSGGFGAKGGRGGRRMTIRRAIDPQFFIRDGANLAEKDWRAAVLAVEARAVRRLAPLLRP